MKILHTSDWHLGHSLYSYDRQEEQTDMLRQIVDIVREEQPDIFLLSGDVYDTSQPSAATQHLFADIMTDLHRAATNMQIFVTAGNHDSPSRHDIYSRPWKALNVNTIGSIISNSPDELIFKVEGIGFVIAVPYVYWRNMPENLYRKLVEKVGDMNSDNLPVVMMAHTSVAGVNHAGHDHSNDLTVGGIDCMAPEEFGNDFDYLALGHIHKPQTLRSQNPAIRYSGSPLAVSFDENYDHSVTLVNIEKRGNKPEIREISIRNQHPLITLPREGAAPFDIEDQDDDANAVTALRLVSDLPDDLQAYIRLNVEIEDFLPLHAREMVLEAIADKECRFCTFNIFRKEKTAIESEDNRLSVTEFREMAPIEVAQKYTSELNINLSDEQLMMLKEIFDQVPDNEIS
ncbi:MAG: exonuclease SbcCD subunit D [Muribaculaceae bacterium]|nr:exonuclease SbcCD subunit D [Muribaculaceae bacterium]